MTAFPEISRIPFEGPQSKNPLAFRHYNADEKVEGNTMRDHLRFSVVYWHTFRGTGTDPFGPGTMPCGRGTTAPTRSRTPRTAPAWRSSSSRSSAPRSTPSTTATSPPRAKTLAETQQEPRRRREGAQGRAAADRHQAALGHGQPVQQSAATCTAPRRACNADAFAYAAAQVKKALEVTKELGGAGLHLLGRPRRLPEPAGTPT